MENSTMLQCFHWYIPDDGSYWKWLKDEAPKLSATGITAVWLPPACKANAGGYSVGYDIYDLYDLGEFDQKGTIRTKYGTRDEYVEAVEALHRYNISVYADIVLNHLAGAEEEEEMVAIKVNEDNRLEVTAAPEPIKAFTKFTYPGRRGKYSQFVWDKNCFTGIDYASNKNENGIYSISNEYGEGWEDMVDDEKGNFDYLMYNDIDFRNPAVREELKRWGEWYYNEIKFDGVRLDAVKHISPKFYNEWLDHMRVKVREDLFAVGEYWAPGKLNLLLKYIDATEGRMSLFDASLHHKFHVASVSGNSFNMADIFTDTLTQVNPLLSVTVVDNHDTQPLQALEAPVEHWFKPLAYALILLRQEGYPCIFYPDIYGATYTDKGKDGNDHEIFLAPCENIPELIQARKKYAFGEQRDYFDHGNCIGWTRSGDEVTASSGCAVILSNGDAGAKNMEMGSRHAGKIMVDMLQKQNREVIINDEGWGEFFCSPGSVSVWVFK